MRSLIKRAFTGPSPARSLLFLAPLAFAFLVPSASMAQVGSVTGTILNATTGEPLESVQVSLESVPEGETGIRGLTQATGRYLLLNVPAGRYMVRAELIGFGTLTQIVEVVAGESIVADFRLAPEAISLSEIVVTGTVGATQRTKLPFEVAQVRAVDLPVPSVNAVQSVQGRVAGALVVQGDGLPGTAPSILLRGVTALNAEGRNQDPLYIVDGVILGEKLVDMGGVDIQSIEVIKGAAAASFYGSRAANGVIQIRTRRGAEMPDDRIRYTFRSEYGGSGLARDPEIFYSDSHPYALSGDGLAFLDEDGNPCQWLECASLALAGQTAGEGPATKWNTYQSNPFPGKTYDQVERFFTHGNFVQNHIAAEGRSGRTNFRFSGSHLVQEGIIRYLPSFRRTDVRLNLDQSVTPDLTVQASVFYSRSSRPSEDPWTALKGLSATPSNVDLLERDPEDPEEVAFIVGPGNEVNPLYDLQKREDDPRRDRFMGSATIRYSPREWLSVDGDLSLDRLAQDRERVVPKGYKTVTKSLLNDGWLRLDHERSEAVNGSLTATGRWTLTDRIRNTTQLRYLIETLDQKGSWIDAYGFAADNVPVFDNVDQDNIRAGSDREAIRADGAFLISNFDLLDRYVVDALIRNDGSSLFGKDERRQWYYRIGGAWRLGQEPFFTVPGVDELKLRYSVGTAGGRPQFNAQYETFDVSGGRISPVRLGNRDLRPEFSTEHEAGVDLSFLDYRVGLSLTYARTTTEDQILEVPQPGVTGYTSQWQNVGTVQSRTWEASLDLRLVDRPDLTWSTRVLFDATRSKITDLYLPEFKYGDLGVFLSREGEEIGAFYGPLTATRCADLPATTLTEVGCDEFAVNDDGFLVWVGEGGSLGDPRWGTEGPLVSGRTTMWGTPIQGVCLERDGLTETEYCLAGNSLPDYNLSLSTSLSWKGFSVYALFTRSAGFDLLNNTLWTKLASGTSRFSDQTGLPQEEQKPIGYYEYMVATGYISTVLVEDGTFTKLRELSLTYQVSSGLLDRVPGLGRLSGVSLNLTGRNLFTWTDYRGYDPEVGTIGGDTGSAAIGKLDRWAYPNFRTVTGSIEVVF
jgi:TonB-linked SusC/RagA family outer membrane protein